MLGKYFPSVGGIATHIYELSSALAAYGHEVYVVSYEKSEASNVFASRIINIKGLRGLTFFLTSIKTVKKIAKEKDIDVVHAHYLLPAGLAGVVAGKKVKKPVVVTAHGTDVFRYNRKTFSRLIKYIKDNAEVIVVSKYLQGLLGFGKVIYNGVDFEKFYVGLDKDDLRAKLHLPPGTLLLYVGSLIKEKGVERLIDAFPQILREINDARLLIIGDGPLRKYLQYKAKGLPVIFLSSKPYNEIPLYMNACDALIVPSTMEGFGLTILEGMAAGLPVIANNIPPFREIIENCRDGLLVNIENKEEFADAILKVITDENFRKNLIEHGIEKAKQFSWQNVAKKVIEVYEESIKNYEVKDVK